MNSDQFHPPEENSFLNEDVYQIDDSELPQSLKDKFKNGEYVDPSCEVE